MKKTLSVLLALTLLALVGCATAASSAPASVVESTPVVDSVSAPSSVASAASTPVADGSVKKVGVVQFVDHEALNASYEGFVDALAEAGYVDGENIKIDLQNAQGEVANCPTIASKLVNDKSDLILAIATPAAQAVANATTDIPVLFTAVTDPVDAKLVASVEAPGANVTGTSDLTPVRQQMELLKKILPDAKKVGFLYSSNEANSAIQIAAAKEAADELGLAYEDYTISSTNELQSVVTSMIGKVDAIYSPTDNLVANAISTVASIANENKIPVIVGEENMVNGGALASISISYYELGKITGRQAVEILQGTGVPATMPVQYQEEFELIVNQETVAALGITMPDDL